MNDRTQRLPQVGDTREIRPGLGLVGTARVEAVDEQAGTIHVSVTWDLEENTAPTADLTATPAP